jgi:hypothetical protein
MQVVDDRDPEDHQGPDHLLGRQLALPDLQQHQEDERGVDEIVGNAHGAIVRSARRLHIGPRVDLRVD